MSTIYSERFLAVTQAGVYVGYTVPVGKRAIVRCLSAVNFGNAAGGSSCYVAGAVLAEARLPAGTQQVLGELYAPVYGGEVITVINSVSTVHTVVAGYLFDDITAGHAPPYASVEGPPLVTALPHRRRSPQLERDARILSRVARAAFRLGGWSP